MRTQKKLIFVVALLFSLISSPVIASGPLTCAQLGTELAALPDVFTLTAALLPADSPSRCEVNFTYSSRGGPEYGYEEGEQQQVKIRVGLPLNSVDGGTGGVEGAWNGRTRGLGGGGCVGSVGSVTTATNAGYVGSSTDAGHVGGDCLFALQPDPTRLNIGRLNDFIVDSLIAQVRWSKVIAETYYGLAPARNYWDGCSTGGRQGFALAQNYPEELDGWLVGAPGVNYGRFRMAQIWGQLAMKDLVGGPILMAKLNQATTSAIAACDSDDGVVDSIINDPRTCKFSAAANICGEPTAPATNCLTPEEAAAIDLIWDGPRNAYGLKIFPGLPIGAPFGTLNGTNPSQTATSQIRWNHEDASFDWKTLTMADYADEAESGSNTNGDIINTMDVSLERVREGGKKILMWHGAADGSITTENSMNYYTRVAAHFGHGTPDFGALQSWFRYFRAPGVGHCGGGNGPQPLDLFETMVRWVENGVAPDQVLASGGGRTRPLCPFPQTAVYNGAGDPNLASSFHCGGNVQTKDTICFGLITEYKHETEDELQAYGRYNPAACNPKSKVPLP